jgi:hypothetical protein
MNEHDLKRTTVRAHTRKRESAPRITREESKAATAATLALRTTQHDAEKYARALVGVLRRWCDDCALQTAQRMVAILEAEK